MATVERTGLRAKIIYNPESGDKLQKAQIAKIAATRLQEVHNWQVVLEPTKRSGHARELAREAALDEFDVVFAMGGDGTVNEVARGLLWSNTKLAILPEGTVNIGARETKISRNTQKAIDDYVQGNVHQMDVAGVATRGKEGTVYGNIILFIADLGHVGRTINSIHEPGKTRKKSGVMPQIWEGAKQIRNADTPPAVLTIDGEETAVEHLSQVFINNTQNLSFIDGVRPDARADDGKLEVTIFSGKHKSSKRNILSLTRSLFGKLLGRRRPSSQEIHKQGERIIIKSQRPLYGDIDGEPLGLGEEREIFVMPEALSVLVPKSEEVRIFSKPGTPLIPSIAH